MANINGTNGDDNLTGTSGADSIDGKAGNDQIQAGNGADTIKGGSDDDTIYAGGGNDVIYGDDGSSTGTLGLDASALTLSRSNLESNPWSNSEATYSNVATLDDGTVVNAKLVLISKSDSGLQVDLSGDSGQEILLNGNNKGKMEGETATIRMEFYNAVTGEPISINSTATFNDIDSERGSEQVSIDSASFTSYGTSSDTSLDVQTDGGTVVATGTEANSASDQDAWFSAAFENQSSITFTLTARGVNSGYTLSGDVIDDVDETELDPGDDEIHGGAGADTIYGEAGDDTLYGDDGDDDIYGGEGNDTISGGQGQDEIEGGLGDDVISGGSGDDTISGGAGDDTIYADGDNDSLSGDEGSDRFVVTASGNTTISGGEDADSTDQDVIELSRDTYDYDDYRVVYTNGDPSAESGVIELLDANGNVTRRIKFEEVEQIVCFTPGTGIATPDGTVAAEQLCVGDRVFTRDNGAQEIAWVGRKDLSTADLQRQKDLIPVMIAKGALGNGLPDRDLIVSPQHRVLLSSDRAALYFEEREVLSAAKHLVGLPGIVWAKPLATSYIHFMCENHEVVLSNGAWTETFQPGAASMSGLENGQRDEILTLFPELATVKGMNAYISARKTLKKHETRLLMAS